MVQNPTVHCEISYGFFVCAVGPGVGVCARPNHYIDGLFPTEVTVSGTVYFYEGTGPGYQCCSKFLS